MASFEEIYKRALESFKTSGHASCVKDGVVLSFKCFERDPYGKAPGYCTGQLASHGKVLGGPSARNPEDAARQLAMHCSNPDTKTTDDLEIIKGILPIVGICTVVVVAIAVLGRVYTGRRAYYQDGQYLVSVRYPGQLNDIREFVQPHNPEVIAIYSQNGPDYWSLYDFVCRNINYRRDIGEFWQTPSETLKGMGDCEDTSILLTSLIRAGAMPAYTILGSLQGYGHAWCEVNGQLLETTYTSARPVPAPQAYCPYVCFNDQEVVEFWPGALGEVFELSRDEATKLNLMARALEAVA